MSKALERRLVAVMFTDMVGYTALLQADERVGIDKRQRYLAALEATTTRTVGRSCRGWGTEA